MLTEKTPTPWPNWSIKHLWILLIVITSLSRLPSLLHPKPVDDERTYALVATEMYQGGELYINAIERKPPLLFWIYEGLFHIGGLYNWLFIHIVSIIWVLLTMWALFLIGRSMFSSFTGWCMAALYGFFQHWFHYSNLAFNGELIMNMPIAWAYFIAIRQEDSKWRPSLPLAGALMAAAFLIKQPAAIAAVPLGLYLLLPYYQKSRNISFVNGFFQAGFLTIGFALCLGVVMLIIYNKGIFEEALFWTIGHHDIPQGK